MRGLMVFVACALLLGTVIFGIAVAQLKTPPAVESEDDGRFGVYHPDRPDPPNPDGETIYAERIVLRGPDATITLDADPSRGSPGITVVSRKTGQVATLYVAKDGRAVVGIRDKGERNLPAALFSTGGDGYLQLREGQGAHVLRPDEIVNRR